MCRYCGGKPPPVDSGITSIGGAFWREDCDNGDGGATTPVEAAYWWDSRADSGATAAAWRTDVADDDATSTEVTCWRDGRVDNDAGTVLSNSTCFRDTQQQQALEDENFRLKLRVFMLEERLQRMQASAQANSADPKEAGLRRQLVKKQQLLERASAALEQLERRNSSHAEAQRQQLAMLKHQLEQSHQQLQEVKQQMDVTHRELEDSRHQGNETEEQLSKALDQLMEMHQQLEETQQSLTGMQEQLVGTQQQLSVTRRKLTEAHQQLDASRQELAETQHRLKSAERLQHLQSATHIDPIPNGAARGLKLPERQTDSVATLVLRSKGLARSPGRIISQITALKAHGEDSEPAVKQLNISGFQQCSPESCSAQQQVLSLHRQLSTAAARHRRQLAAAAARLQLQTERARCLQASCAQLTQQLLSWRRQRPPATSSPRPAELTEAERQACVASSTEVEAIADLETPPLVSPELDVTFTCKSKTHLGQSESPAGVHDSEPELGALQPRLSFSDKSVVLLLESDGDFGLKSEDFTDAVHPREKEDDVSTQLQRQGEQWWCESEETHQVDPALRSVTARPVDARRTNVSSTVQRRAPLAADCTEEDSRSEPDQSVSRARIGLPQQSLEPPTALNEQRSQQADSSTASDTDDDHGTCTRCSCMERRLRRRVRILRQLQRSLSAECAIYRQLEPRSGDAVKPPQAGASFPDHLLEEISQLRQKLASFISRDQELNRRHNRSSSPPAEFALALTITQEALTESAQKVNSLQQRQQRLKARLDMTQSLLADCRQQRDHLQQEYSSALYNMRMMQQDVDQLEADNQQLRAANKQLLANTLLSTASSHERLPVASKHNQLSPSLNQRLIFTSQVSNVGQSISSTSSERRSTLPNNPEQLPSTEQQLAQLASRRLQLLAEGVRLRSSCRLLRTEELLLQMESPVISRGQRSESIEALASRLRNLSSWNGSKDENEDTNIYTNEEEQKLSAETFAERRFGERQERNRSETFPERRERKRSSSRTAAKLNPAKERRELGLGPGALHASKNSSPCLRVRHPAGRVNGDDPVDSLVLQIDLMKLDDISHEAAVQEHRRGAADPRCAGGTSAGSQAAPPPAARSPAVDSCSRHSSTSSPAQSARTPSTPITESHHSSGDIVRNFWTKPTHSQVVLQPCRLPHRPSFGVPAKLSLR